MLCKTGCNSGLLKLRSNCSHSSINSTVIPTARHEYLFFCSVTVMVAGLALCVTCPLTNIQ